MMKSISYRWRDGEQQREFSLAHVPGTHDAPYSFGDPSSPHPVAIQEFFVSVTPVTQAFWQHITGTESPAIRRAADLPVENVSWDALTAPRGFLEKMNESAAAASLREQAGRSLVFRLPSETEWEYAARGGPHWRDGFQYSGSNDVAAVAWYDRRHGDWTQPVAMKAPNQLGVYDMSGNVWEWCEDTFTRDVAAVPSDGSAYCGAGEERVLRGGCFHNWAAHCTISKRYEIAHDYHDGCIGFRVAMGEQGRTR